MPEEMRSNSSGLSVLIDASNISSGGGLTHLVKMLGAANPNEHGFAKVILWSSSRTLERIGDKPWLTKCTNEVMESSYVRRGWWQRSQLGRIANDAKCDVLYVPGGSVATNFHPVVTMNRNLLPFEYRELFRYGWSLMTLRLLLLRRSQSRSIRRADATIFLTKYAEDAVTKVAGAPRGITAIIPHGIGPEFFQSPRHQRALSDCDDKDPFRFVYVSIVDTYKHQWTVAEAIGKLRKEGLPVTLDIVGPAYKPSLRKLERTLDRVDPAGQFIRYRGPVAQSEMRELYANSDVAVFASSCETFGQIVTEYMAAGLPVACSNRSAMPELLGDAGAYFDPEQDSEIATVLKRLAESPQTREKMADASYTTAKSYSWQRCAMDTFALLARVASESQDSDAVER
jgi:glycosyltransferase involved in cell wall biosynthesis